MKIKSSSIAMIYLGFVMFMPNTLYLLNQPGIPLISARRAFIIGWALFFAILFTKRRGIWQELLSFPFYRSIVIFIAALSMIVSLTFGNNPQSILGFSTTILEAILPIFLFWTALKEKEQIYQAARWMVYLYALMAVYGVIAHFTDTNPLLVLLTDDEGASRKLTYLYDDFERGGVQGRAQSFFAHSIVFGYLSAVILVVLVGVQRALKIFPLREYIAIGALLLVSIVLAGSRSPLMLLIMAGLIYVAHQRVAKIITALISFVFIFTLVVGSGIADLVLGSYTQMVSSIFQDMFSDESSLGGSSFGMRMMQLDAAIKLFWESPIYGHGFAYIRSLLENEMTGDLLGGESFAYSLLVEMGVIGILGYLVLFKGIYSSFRTYLQRGYSEEINNLAFTGIALLGGHISFIIVTGEMGVSPIFLMLETLLLRMMYVIQSERVHQVNVVNLVSVGLRFLPSRKL